MGNILEVQNLRVDFQVYGGAVAAVRGVDLQLKQGETLAIVGESGSGKSATAKAMMRLLHRTSGRIAPESRIDFDGRSIADLSQAELSRIRGNDISMIFQDSMTSLNPTMTIGRQITEVLRRHRVKTPDGYTAEAVRLLQRVGIANAPERIKHYPHQLSGGMRQRVMIAIAIACSPKLLIADEPTTALDVTVQFQVMGLLEQMTRELDMSMLLITHDLGVVAHYAHRVAVMYAGQIVEEGRTTDLFAEARHPYTWALLKSMPGLSRAAKDQLYSLRGTPPDLISPITGCAFAPRCDSCMPVCRRLPPERTRLASEHTVVCWLSHPMAPTVESGVVLEEVEQ